MCWLVGETPQRQIVKAFFPLWGRRVMLGRLRHMGRKLLCYLFGGGGYPQWISTCNWAVGYSSCNMTSADPKASAAGQFAWLCFLEEPPAKWLGESSLIAGAVSQQRELTWNDSLSISPGVCGRLCFRSSTSGGYTWKDLTLFFDWDVCEKMRSNCSWLKHWPWSK